MNLPYGVISRSPSGLSIWLDEICRPPAYSVPTWFWPKPRVVPYATPPGTARARPVMTTTGSLREKRRRGGFTTRLRVTFMGILSVHGWCGVAEQVDASVELPQGVGGVAGGGADLEEPV